MFEVKCPACNKKLDSWIFTSPNVADPLNFKCEYCKVKLKSNHKNSLKKAIIIGIGLYVVFTFILNSFIFNEKINQFIAIVGTIAPFLASLLLYRVFLKVDLINSD